MAVINIDKDYRIRSDPYQWILEKSRIPEKGKDKGNVVWDNVSYHPSIKQSCEAYLEKSLRLSDAESLQDLIGIADKCQEKIEGLFKEVNI